LAIIIVLIYIVIFFFCFYNIFFFHNIVIQDLLLLINLFSSTAFNFNNDSLLLKSFDLLSMFWNRCLIVSEYVEPYSFKILNSNFTKFFFFIFFLFLFFYITFTLLFSMQHLKKSFLRDFDYLNYGKDLNQNYFSIGWNNETNLNLNIPISIIFSLNKLDFLFNFNKFFQYIEYKLNLKSELYKSDWVHFNLYFIKFSELIVYIILYYIILILIKNNFIYLNTVFFSFVDICNIFGLQDFSKNKEWFIFFIIKLNIYYINFPAYITLWGITYLNFIIILFFGYFINLCLLYVITINIFNLRIFKDIKRYLSSFNYINNIIFVFFIVQWIFFSFIYIEVISILLILLLDLFFDMNTYYFCYFRCIRFDIFFCIYIYLMYLFTFYMYSIIVYHFYELHSILIILKYCN